MINKIVLLLIVGVELVTVSCSTMDMSERMPLIMTFVDLRDTYSQGLMKVVIQIENPSDKEIVLKNWQDDNSPNNFGLYARPRQFNDGKIADAYPRNSGTFIDFVIPPKTKIQVTSGFVCNLSPNDYEFQARLLSNQEIKTKWQKCRINPGKILDTRKGTR